LDEIAGGWVVWVLGREGAPDGEVENQGAELGDRIRRVGQAFEVLEEEGRGTARIEIGDLRFQRGLQKG
jgi:hypothetical protein